ncbi:hypothetical protein M5689_011580 [Euphorbia peplus]|nr:hypothetical protein M5689_011580 [Euphorbia peplus]
MKMAFTSSLVRRASSSSSLGPVSTRFRAGGKYLPMKGFSSTTTALENEIASIIEAYQPNDDSRKPTWKIHRIRTPVTFPI